MPGRMPSRLRLLPIVAALRLVELYKADRPDIVTVVLNANGFQELLESADFMRRISDQDARILDRVRTAKAQSEATAARLAGLEARAQAVANAIEQRRNE